jgi:hypothetical protein
LYANPTSLFSPAQQSSVFSIFTELADGFFKPSSFGLSDATPPQASSDASAPVDAIPMDVAPSHGEPSLSDRAFLNQPSSSPLDDFLNQPSSGPPDDQAQITSAAPRSVYLGLGSRFGSSILLGPV